MGVTHAWGLVMHTAGLVNACHRVRLDLGFGGGKARIVQLWVRPACCRAEGARTGANLLAGSQRRTAGRARSQRRTAGRAPSLHQQSHSTRAPQPPNPSSQRRLRRQGRKKAKGLVGASLRPDRGGSERWGGGRGKSSPVVRLDGGVCLQLAEVGGERHHAEGVQCKAQVEALQLAVVFCEPLQVGHVGLQAERRWWLGGGRRGEACLTN